MSDFLPMRRATQEHQPTTLMPPSSDNILRDFFRVLFRHKRKVTLYCLLVILAATYVILNGNSTYTSETKLLVRRGRESLTLDPTAMGTVVPVWKDWDNELNSEYEILRSRALLETVVLSIGMEEIIKHASSYSTKSTPSLGHGVEALKASLEIELMRKSDLIRIRYTCLDLDHAKLVVSQLVDAYLDKHIDVHRSHGAYDFFEEQTDLCRKRLKETEASLRNLKNELGISSLEDRRNINLNRIKMLQQQQERVDSKHAATKAKISTLSDKVGRTNRAESVKHIVSGNYSHVNLESALLSEELNLAALMAESKTLNSQIARKDLRSTNLTRMKSLQDRRERTQSDIASSQAKIQTLTYAISKQMNRRGKNAGGLNTESYVGIQSALWAEDATLASLTAEASVVEAQLDEAKSEIRRLNDYETKIQWLERQRSETEAKYLKYQSNLEQARIDQALEEKKLSNIRIVQPPSVPLGRNPSYRKIEALLAMFLCLFGGIGVAFMSEMIDQTVDEPGIVEEKLRLPTLISIPTFKGGITNYRVKPKAGTRSANASRHIWSKEHDHIREHFEKLAYRTSSLMNEYGGKQSLIGVLSTSRGEGATSVAINLATALARQDKDTSVLFVDSGIHQPYQHGGALKRAAGVSEIRTNAAGETSVLEEKLYMLGDDTYPENPQMVIPYTEVVEMVRSRTSNYAVFDMPPLTDSISVARFASMMDCVIMVVDAGKTRCHMAQNSRRLLDESGVDILGVVLNRRQYHIPNWLYQKLG